MSGTQRRSSWQQRAAVRFGWRGVYLQAIGAAWVLIGAATTIEPVQAQPWVLIDYVPSWVRGLGWIVTGVVAIVVGRRNQVDDSLGHVALYLVPAIRAASYAASWVTWLSTSVAHNIVHRDVGVIGWRQAMAPAAVWLSVIVFLSICARWPNATPLPHPPLVPDPSDPDDALGSEDG
jgi:hypothetical protein